MSNSTAMREAFNKVRELGVKEIPSPERLFAAIKELSGSSLSKGQGRSFMLLCTAALLIEHLEAQYKNAKQAKGEDQARKHELVDFEGRLTACQELFLCLVSGESEGVEELNIEAKELLTSLLPVFATHGELKPVSELVAAVLAV
jgi:hypothetical protein